MLKKDLPKVFPLHLAPIDVLFCADDRPRYPMTSVIQLDFRGAIDRLAFACALEDGLDRHPLLCALIKPAKRSLPCWVRSNGVKPPIDWGPLEQPVRCQGGEAIDLDQEVGLRVWGRCGENQTQLVLQVHHACTDGTGVYRFLGDVLACYGIRTSSSDSAPELGPLDPRLLRSRRTKMSGLAGTGSTSQFIRNGFREVWDMFGKRIQPIHPPHANGGAKEPLAVFPGIRSFDFDREQHKRLRNAAGNYGVMLNDLLLAEMFQTVLTWNERKRGVQQRGRLRIMMPFDLRDKQDFEMPAANMTAYTFITRKAAACRDLMSLVRGIRDETARIKHGRQGTSFIDTLMLADYSPKVLKYLLSRDRCISSVTLSNVGDPSRRFTARLPRVGGKVQCGNLVLEKVSGVPPLRPHTYATLAIFTYAREMTISVRCDPYRFTIDESQEFLDLYAERLSTHL